MYVCISVEQNVLSSIRKRMTTPSMNDEAQKLMNEQTDKVSCRADFQWLQTKKMFFFGMLNYVFFCMLNYVYLDQVTYKLYVHWYRRSPLKIRRLF